eukprot:SAG22_NODE_8942_length_619_cov_2.265385_1_plen_81_part_10
MAVVALILTGQEVVGCAGYGKVGVYGDSACTLTCVENMVERRNRWTGGLRAVPSSQSRKGRAPSLVGTLLPRVVDPFGHHA